MKRGSWQLLVRSSGTFFKKHALLSKASKKREITGTKQCDASMEEYNMAAAMIDAEAPVPGIHGVSVDGNQKAKKQRNLEQQAEKKEEVVKKEQEKLEAMSNEEKQAYVEQKAKAEVLNTMKLLERALNDGRGKAAHMQDRIMSMKQTPYLNPKKLVQSLQSQMELMQQHTEVLVKLRGMGEALSLVVLESKKFKQAIKKAEELKETRVKKQCLGLCIHAHPQIQSKSSIHPQDIFIPEDSWEGCKKEVTKIIG